jgi:hypothetical protein
MAKHKNRGAIPQGSARWLDPERGHFENARMLSIRRTRRIAARCFAWLCRHRERLAFGLAWLGLALFGVSAYTARADVPPGPGYIESCTVELQQIGGTECVACGDAYHGDREACARKLAPQGYARRCKSRGASVWTEVWCREQKAAAPAPAEVKPAEATPAVPAAQNEPQPTPAPAPKAEPVAPAPKPATSSCGALMPTDATLALLLGLVVLRPTRR